MTLRKGYSVHLSYLTSSRAKLVAGNTPACDTGHAGGSAAPRGLTRPEHHTLPLIASPLLSCVFQLEAAAINTHHVRSRLRRCLICVGRFAVVFLKLNLRF
ncbi:hypothetical protein EVAR_82149_1 [Eumeta japonica]|uniref:Uncharacterized protein n=1 Tax=Eumeta variegata TaxID=151549 RepID=A0A4C1U1P4_EUMVA|nr:hypothetical protein EVAR_82149_1 [Eumeta japonica]